MRAAQNDPMVNIVAVNDPFIPVNYMEYMMEFDTTHGKYLESSEKGTHPTSSGEMLEQTMLLSPLVFSPPPRRLPCT
jgi:glyceraldehyde-3-phosphate dehydrogenase/erythrose-4-phosphate dehydrogenase